MYKIHEYRRLHADVNRLLPEFRGGFKQRFIDNLLTAICGRWILDIERFDEWLHELYGEYENAGFSMKEIIREKMGADALKMIEELI